MKNNRILRFIMVYSFIELALQGIGMNCVFAFQRLDDKKFADVRIKITNNEVPLEQLFRIIEQQTNLKFFYIKEDVPLKTKVNVHQEEESLNQILQSLAKEFGLSFSRINNQIVVKKSETLQSEIFNFQGTVRDASTNEPLAFASIVVEGTQLGTMTSAGGKFTIVLPEDTSHLRCSYVGYKTEIVDCTGQKNIPIAIRLYSMDMLLQDVTVYAHRLDGAGQTEVSVLSLQSDNIKNITSAIPDVMRSIQMLPGVSANNEFSAKFNVRGGNQDENLVLVNGTQVYDPFHIKEASNASIGIFNVDMIQKMDLITGGFTARYGDRMSSVLNIDYREGNRDQMKGMASLSMTNLDGVVEGPIGDHGSYIFSGRKSYFEYVLKMLNVDPNMNLGFYDIQGVIGYSLSPRQKLTLKFIHAGDDYSLTPHRNDQTPYSWTNYPNQGAYPAQNKQLRGDSAISDAEYYTSMISLQSINILSSSAILKSEISFYDQRDVESSYKNEYGSWEALYRQSTYFYNYRSEYLYKNNLRIQTLELNSTLEMQIGSSYEIETGLSYQYINYF
jgi:hypothetical protein